MGGGGGTFAWRMVIPVKNESYFLSAGVVDLNTGDATTDGYTDRLLWEQLLRSHSLATPNLTSLGLQLDSYSSSYTNKYHYK